VAPLAEHASRHRPLRPLRSLRLAASGGFRVWGGAATGALGPSLGPRGPCCCSSSSSSSGGHPWAAWPSPLGQFSSGVDSHPQFNLRAAGLLDSRLLEQAKPQAALAPSPGLQHVPGHSMHDKFPWHPVLGRAPLHPVHGRGPFCILCLAASLGSVDFVEEGTGIPVFRTCDQERDQVVFQMGTSEPHPRPCGRADCVSAPLRPRVPTIPLHCRTHWCP